MSSDSLNDAAARLTEALHSHRTSTTAWETANSFFHASDSHLPHLNQVSDPGVRLHSSQPLPDTFISQYRNVQFKSFMGLFPQINRAWLTVDSNLFLWGYTPFRQSVAQNDFYVFEGISQVIVSVALVTPRPGVFVDSIAYLLAVATPVEVTLLGVSFSPTGQLSLIPTQIAIATDNTVMLKIVSSDDGRIFMAGSDGHLHEFVYGPQNSSSFINVFASRAHKRARKVSHTSSFASYLLPASVRSYMAPNKELIDLTVERSSLYTLSQSGVLAVYDICSSVTLIATSSIASEAKHLFSYSVPSSEREFVSIHTVSPPFSASVQLVVVTSLAERIYYTTRPSSTYSDNGRPTTLKCIAYRPSPDANVSRTSHPCVHIAWCDNGTAVFADLRENSSDRLLCIYPDSTIASNQAESHSDAQASSLSSVEIVVNTDLSAASQGDPQTVNGRSLQDSFEGADVSRQLARTFAIADACHETHASAQNTSQLDRPSFFWVLTSTSMLLFERVQPTDRLSSLLSSVGSDSAEVARFFERYGAGDASAMALEIAVSQPACATVAAKVFYTGSGAVVSDLDANVGRQARETGPDLGPRGSIRPNFDLGRPASQSTPLIRFSGAHEGLVLFLAKILHPIWNSYVTSSRDPKAYQRLEPSQELILNVREQLQSLVVFFDRFSPDAMLPEGPQNAAYPTDTVSRGFHSGSLAQRLQPSQLSREGGSVTDSGFSQQQSLHHAECRRIESAAISSLQNLAIRTAESLSLLKIVSEHQLHRLVVSMPERSVKDLVDARLSDLVSREKGSPIAASLIKAIFAVYPDGAVAVSNVGHLLQEQCPSFFGESDADLHRGLSLLRSAADSLPDSATLLEDLETTTANTFPRNGTTLHEDDMEPVRLTAQTRAEEAASMLKQVPDKVFEIYSVCNDFVKVGAIPALVEVALCVGKRAESDQDLDRAMECYECVVGALRPLVCEVDLAREETPASKGRQALREASLHAALKSESELFLKRLFDFLRSGKMGEDILLKNSSPHLEKYLKETNSRDLLWRYYSRHGMYVDAASILLNMAEVEENSLVDKVNYLSCALHNANTAVSKGDHSAATILKEISNFMDVAKVQLRIREELLRERPSGVDVETAMGELDAEILPLSTLFNKYARPFKLHEACLDALRCGSYRDDGYVRALWTEIVDREANTSGAPAILSHRIETLGREFYPSDVVFPTVFIIDLLERYVFRNQSSEAWREKEGWVCDTVRGIGVPLSDLVDGYRVIVESPQVSSADGGWSWSDERAQMHILRAAEGVIRLQLKALMSGSQGSRSRLSECDRATRAVQMCKSRIRSMSQDYSSDLWNRFEALERSIATLQQ